MRTGRLFNTMGAQGIGAKSVEPHSDDGPFAQARFISVRPKELRCSLKRNSHISVAMALRFVGEQAVDVLC